MDDQTRDNSMDQRTEQDTEGKKKGIIRGGIQCIKDSGLKYTVKLFF